MTTDYCVNATFMDARARGLSATDLAAGVAGVDIPRGDAQRALEAMDKAVVRIVNVDAMFYNSINK